MKDSGNQERFQQLITELEENYTEARPPNIQLMVGFNDMQCLGFRQNFPNFQIFRFILSLASRRKRGVPGEGGGRVITNQSTTRKSSGLDMYHLSFVSFPTFIT